MSFKGNAVAFIDEANISSQTESLGLRIDWKKLLAYLNENYNLLRSYLYTGIDLTVRSKRNFVLMLKRSGYRVVHHRGFRRSDGSVKANLDVHLAVDMVSMAERYDIAILFSGDGDFIPAVEDISRKGVRVEVISLEDSTSNELMNIVDSFRDLDEFLETEKLIFGHEDQEKDEEDDFREEMRDREVVSRIRDILESVPSKVFPVPKKVIENRALQLDEKNEIDQTSFGSYAKLLNEFEVMQILLTTQNDGNKVVQEVDFEALKDFESRLKKI